MEKAHLVTGSAVISMDFFKLVLAGLISQVKNQQHEGVTGLGKLPLVGGWFKHVEDTVQTRELVIFITPHIRERV